MASSLHVIRACAIITVVWVCELCQCGVMTGHDFFVATNGDDSAQGSDSAPFRSIQQCVRAAVSPGDRCHVRGGIYRENVSLLHSGTAAAQITVAAADGEAAIVSSLDLVSAGSSGWKWLRNTQDGGRVYETRRLEHQYRALYVDGLLQMSGRWPHTRLVDSWERSHVFALTGPRSKIEPASNLSTAVLDVAGGSTPGINWLGALVCMSVGYQSHCSPVLAVPEPGLVRVSAGICLVCTHSTTGFQAQQYTISGLAEAIDVIGEWSQDAFGTLTVALPGNRTPETVVLEGRTRQTGFQYGAKTKASGLLRYVTLANFTLVSAPVYLQQCTGCRLEGLRSIAATTPIEAWLVNASTGAPLHGGGWGQRSGNYVSGSRNVVAGCRFQLDAFEALSINGSNNIVQDCSFTNTAHLSCSPTLFLGTPWWISRQEYNGVSNAVLNCTFVNQSYTGVHNYAQKLTRIEGNHLALGGRLCSDVSPIYSIGETAAGTLIAKNWVHNTRAQWNLLGIRGDDKSRNLTIENNVVWNCGTVGIMAKGKGHHVRHNTLLNNSWFAVNRPHPRSIEMASIHNDQDPTLPFQGEGDICANNVVEHGITGDMISGALPAGQLLGNYFARDARTELRCPPGTGRHAGKACADGHTLDFRPRLGSVLVGGAVAAGKRGGDGFDVGAYTSASDIWVPGCSSNHCVVLLPRPTDPIYAPEANAADWYAPL